MVFLFYILAISGALVIALCAVAIFKAKDVYQSVHFITISNIYGFSLLLIGCAFYKYSFVFFIKIVCLVLCNIIVTLIITQSVARRAMINGVIPIGETQKLN